VGLFDRILGKKHASLSWQSVPGFEIQLDLDTHAICRCRIGDPIEWLSPLGPPEDSKSLREQRYRYYSKGMDIGEEEGKVADFIVFWIDYLGTGFKPFKGLVISRGKRIELDSRTTEKDFVNLFGDPYWRDQDEEEIILFYEFQGDIEWQVEFTQEGNLKALRVVWPPLMAEAAQRELFGVNLPWPPRRASRSI
jgi:hypothetical protein